MGIGVGHVRKCRWQFSLNEDQGRYDRMLLVTEQASNRASELITNCINYIDNLYEATGSYTRGADMLEALKNTHTLTIDLDESQPSFFQGHASTHEWPQAPISHKSQHYTAFLFISPSHYILHTHTHTLILSFQLI